MSEDMSGELAQKIVVASQTVETFASLLVACRQCWVNSNFIESIWPLESHEMDEAEWETKLYFFPETVTGKEGQRFLDEMVVKGEIRWCGPGQAMKYIADHPDVQLGRSVVLPIAKQRSNGDLVFPVFDRCWHVQGRRCLDLRPIDNGYGSDCGWLIRCKRSSVTETLGV